MLTPPESSGVHTTDAAWKMKVKKFTRIMTYFGGGLVVGGVATLLRRSVQEYCPPGSINWSKLCDPTSWFEEEEARRRVLAMTVAQFKISYKQPHCWNQICSPSLHPQQLEARLLLCSQYLRIAGPAAAAAGVAKGKGKGKAKMKAKAKAKVQSSAAFWDLTW
eukprot:Skav218435  [mRNA]  locus=scaffold420:292169:294901:- [translate_table: standard]